MALRIESLHKRGNELAKAEKQVEYIEQTTAFTPSFKEKLKEHHLYPLKANSLDVLQINVGYKCNLSCAHCHVDAGPDRKEEMNRETMELILEAIDKSAVKTVDITGGAPEMNANFKWFVEELSKRNVEIIVRSNLTILVSNPKYRRYVDFFKEHQLIVIASLPCYTQENTDKQRGGGVFKASLEALQLLNNLGYGKEGSNLKLHLVYNPGGASLPPDQTSLERDYKRIMSSEFGIVFNHLYTITNLPISRFLEDLLKKERYEEYMNKLVNAFNPEAAKGVMCRNTLSVDWQGNLYDCDFNQMLQLKVNPEMPNHIKDFDLVLAQREIVLGQHCYGCTAGAGSSCQGSIA